MLRTVMLSSGLRSRTPQSVLGFDLAHLSLEGQLLVLLARTSANGTLQIEIQDRLRDRVDWDLLWQLAQTHGVAPLVYQMLTSYGRGIVPHRMMETFRRHVQTGSILSNLLADELITLVEAFTAKGIGAIPYHGPTLALLAHGDLALRESVELDFVVRKDSIAQARRLLWSHGYQLIGQSGVPGEGQQEPSSSFVKKNGMFRVNLQSVVARGLFAFDLDRHEFWQGLKPMRIGQKTIMTLGAEELLIVLCVRGSTRIWEDLKSICDVAELIRRRRAIDWSRVVFLSREWQCHRLLLMGLAMAHTLFDTPLPGAIRASITADPDVPDLARRMPQQLLRLRREGVASVDAEAFNLTLKDCWTQQCAYAWALCHAEFPVVMTPPPAWCRFYRRLNLLYRLFHPVHQAVAWCTRIQSIRKFFGKRLESPG